MRIQPVKNIREVGDEGDGFELAGLEREFVAVGGHRLKIAETMASRWGIQAGNSHAWFELDRRRPRLEPASEHL